MLSENIKNIRRTRGLSQQELAAKVNVARQTVSKWEQELSVPDSDLLIALSDALETPVSVLLGEIVSEKQPDDLKAISEKLEVINLQLAQRKTKKRKTIHWLFIIMCLMIIITAVVLAATGSPYLEWDYGDPETAVVGTTYHIFEWIFFRVAPILLIGGLIGIIATRNNK